MTDRPIRVVAVPTRPRGISNNFIVVGERSVLVDSGTPGSESTTLAALAREGIAPREVSLILITHRHVDHIGGAAVLKRATGAPVAVHALDADGLRRGDGGPLPTTGWAGRLFNMTGLPGQRAEPCEPDLVIERDLSLEPYGLPGGVVLHTPGHTPGSVSALLPAGDVLAGDLVVGGILLFGIARLHHARKPPFEDDPVEVRRSLLRLLDQGASRFHVGHGGPLTSAEVREYIAREPRLRVRSHAPQPGSAPGRGEAQA